MLLKLPDVTLVAPTGGHYPDTIEAIERSCDKVEFGSVKFVSPEKPDNLPDYIVHEESDRMDTYIAYNDYVFKKLYKHVKTSHCLLVQYDSWVVNPETWRDEWLEWDYIGAPWQIRENSYIAWGSLERVRVGNGGFSLRSVKLMTVPEKLDLPLVQEQGYYNEDGNICCYHRLRFLEEGIEYAPLEVAANFSFENVVSENIGVIPFGFHKNMPPWRV